MKTTIRLFSVVGLAFLAGCVSVQVDEPLVCKTISFTIIAASRQVIIGGAVGGGTADGGSVGSGTTDGGSTVGGSSGGGTVGNGTAGDIKILPTGEWQVELDVNLNPGDLSQFLSNVTLKGGMVFIPDTPDAVVDLDFIEELSVVMRGSSDITLLDYKRSDDNISTILITPRSDNLLMSLQSSGVTFHFDIRGFRPPSSQTPKDGRAEVGLTVCIGGGADKLVDLTNLTTKDSPKPPTTTPVK